MRVTQVKVLKLNVNKLEERCMGTVGLLAGVDKVLVTCDIAYPGVGSEAGLRRAMAYDAIRQLKRMPEFRSGQRALEITENAIR